MRSIEERAEEYAAPVLRLPDDEMINKSQLWLFEKQSFIAGSKSEYAELTKWNSSKEYPELNKYVLIKYKWNKDSEKSLYTVGYVYKDKSSGEIVWNTNDDILAFNLEFVWREIYE